MPWDKKKIVLACLFLLGAILLLITIKTVFFDTDEGSKMVKGIKTEKPRNAFEDIEAPDINGGLEDRVELIKDDLENVDVEEIASSSPQIQKILNDIKSIKDLPSSTARQTCENLCKNF